MEGKRCHWESDRLVLKSRLGHSLSFGPTDAKEACLLNCDWGSACNAVVRFRESVWQVYHTWNKEGG